MIKTIAVDPPVQRATHSPALAGKIVFWCCIAVLAAACTFVVPFLFPMKSAVYSPAYTAGGNNRVGAMLTALLSVMVTLWLWIRRQVRSVRSYTIDEPVPPALFTAGVVVTFGFSSLLGWAVTHSGIYYADAGYFITQLRSGLLFHEAPYRDFEFAYGPVLYYLPAIAARVLAPLHVSLTAAYVCCYVTVQVAGVWLIRYVVEALPMRQSLRAAAFCFVVLCTLNPQAGLNYTAFRFLFPAATFVFLAKQKRLGTSLAVAGLGLVVQFLISPELALAFLAGCILYGALCFFTLDRGYAFVAVSATVGAILCVLCVGPAYFRTLLEFAKGGFNELLEPAPHIYVLLLCAVGLAPLVVAGALAEQRFVVQRTLHSVSSQTGILVGFYAIGLIMLSPALGRCDPLHVSFNGLCLFSLGFVALDRLQPAWRTFGLVMAVVFCCYTLGQEYALEKGKLAQVVLAHRDPTEDADLPRLMSRLNGSSVSIPFDPPMRVVNRLTAAGVYVPSYLCIPPADSTAERALITQMRRTPYVLIHHDESFPSENKINNEGIRYRLRFGYRYKTKRAPYIQGQLTQLELNQHWRRVGIFGSYLLYQRQG